MDDLGCGNVPSLMLLCNVSGKAEIQLQCHATNGGPVLRYCQTRRCLHLPQVVDVFAMPQSGTGVSVEAVDPVFQTKMLDMLKQVGR